MFSIIQGWIPILQGISLYDAFLGFLEFIGTLIPGLFNTGAGV